VFKTYALPGEERSSAGITVDYSISLARHWYAVAYFPLWRYTIPQPGFLPTADNVFHLEMEMHWGFCFPRS
jgi:hypothetical protein